MPPRTLHTIQITNTAFIPAEKEVQKGDTIKFELHERSTAAPLSWGATAGLFKDVIVSPNMPVTLTVHSAAQDVYTIRAPKESSQETMTGTINVGTRGDCEDKPR